jgi:hypothetical protein
MFTLIFPVLLFPVTIISFVLTLIMVWRSPYNIAFSSPYAGQRRFTNRWWLIFSTSFISAVTAIDYILITLNTSVFYEEGLLCAGYCGLISLIIVLISLGKVTSMEVGLKYLRMRGYPWGR